MKEIAEQNRAAFGSLTKYLMTTTKDVHIQTDTDLVEVPLSLGSEVCGSPLIREGGMWFPSH